MKRVVLMTGFLLPLFFCQPVRAQLFFCNGAPLTIEAALGENVGGKWQARGWYALTPGECETVVSGELPQRYYYSYAETPGGKYKWGGKDPFCVSDTAFRIEADRCEAESQRNFNMIEVGETRSHTQWFSCPECIDPRIVNAVRANLRWLENIADQNFPKSRTSEDWEDIGPVDIMYGVGRSPFQLSIDGNRVSISVRLGYWVQISHTRFLFRQNLASCGIDETQPTIDVSLTMIFGVTPEGKLVSKTRSSLTFPTPCNLTMADIDGTEYIRGFAQPHLDRIASTIDSRIGEISISRLVNVKDLY